MDQFVIRSLIVAPTDLREYVESGSTSDCTITQDLNEAMRFPTKRAAEIWAWGYLDMYEVVSESFVYADQVLNA